VGVCACSVNSKQKNKNKRTLEVALRGINKQQVIQFLNFLISKMANVIEQCDATLFMLQNLRKEIENLKKVVDKLPDNVPVPRYVQYAVMQTVQKVGTPTTSPTTTPVVAGEKPKRKLNISAKGMESKVAAGKKLAQLNAMRKEFMENAKLNGEW
jgi:cell division septum initiation protein DivIVA